MDRKRFIPARAGNTLQVILAHGLGDGSSPLARGTHAGRAAGADEVRFIPARAGNTWAWPSTSSLSSVHPRSRGEHYLALIGSKPATGSSPLARGTLRVVARHEPEARFIPARAGNTIGASTAGRPRPVHPRSRGEHFRFAAAESSSAGSSPLARGTRHRRPAAWRHLRFIPARAGNTSSLFPETAGRMVHPRSRGEHVGSHRSTGLPYGSSPLARGTPPVARREPEALRFIPARAGNTRAGRPRRRSPPVHPRSRGEHLG